MATVILTDSSAEFEPHELRDLQVISVPLTITFEEESFLDGVDITKEQFYKRMRESDVFPTTSQPPPAAFAAEFERAIGNGDEVLAVLLSSGLSGTFQSANIAKEMVDSDNIHVVDTLSGVTGVRLLVEYAVERRDAGIPAKEIAAELEELKHRVVITAAVDTLENLHRGGRLTKAQARLGDLVSIKPILGINPEGKLYVKDKALGLAAAYRTILKNIANMPIDTGYAVYLAYSYISTNAMKLKDRLLEIYPSLIIKSIHDIGCIMGAHVGENAYGIVYVQQPK